MDIRMPIIDGLEAFKRIREFNNEIPIIAITSYDSGTNRQEALASGFNDYMLKPIDKRKILNILQE